MIQIIVFDSSVDRMIFAGFGSDCWLIMYHWNLSDLRHFKASGVNTNWQCYATSRTVSRIGTILWLVTGERGLPISAWRCLDAYWQCKECTWSLWSRSRTLKGKPVHDWLAGLFWWHCGLLFPGKLPPRNQWRFLVPAGSGLESNRYRSMRAWKERQSEKRTTKEGFIKDIESK